MDSTNDSGWTTLAELRPGAIFETRDGIRAVKSEYRYPSGGIECVLLASGEAAHFGKTGDRHEHNGTEVREIDVAFERERAALSAALIEGYTRDHTAFLALLSAMGLRTGATDPCGALKGAVALAEDRARVAEREACAAGPAESAPAHVRRELPGADIAVIGAVVSVVLARDGQWREAIRARGSR